MCDGKSNNFAALFDKQAKQSGDQPALIFPEVTFSYKQLRTLGAAFAVKFYEAGVDDRSALQLCTDDPAVVVPTLLAASLLNASVVVVDPLVVPENITHIVATDGKSSKTPRIVIDQTFSPNLQSADTLASIWSDAANWDAQEPWITFAATNPDREARLVHLSHETLIERSYAHLFGVTRNDVRTCILWPTLGYGFVTRVVATLLRGHAVVLDGQWTELANVGVTHLLASNLRLKRALHLIDAGLSCSFFEVAATTAEAWKSIGSLDGFEQVRAVFELAETGILYEEYRARSDTSRRLSHQYLAIAELRLKNEQDDKTTHQTPDELFVQFVGDTDANHFATGLFATRCEDGAPLLADRQDRVFIQGTSVDLAQVERIICGIDGIDDAVVFPSPKPDNDELVCLAVFEENVNRLQISELAKLLCKRVLGDAGKPAKMRPIDLIPRQRSGEPNRTLCAELVLRATKTGAS